MNIYGYKLKLGKARDMLKNLQEELNRLQRKRRKNLEDRLEMDTLFKKIKKIEGGMQNLRTKIENLRLKKKNGKRT